MHGFHQQSKCWSWSLIPLAFLLWLQVSLQPDRNESVIEKNVGWIGKEINKWKLLQCMRNKYIKLILYSTQQSKDHIRSPYCNTSNCVALSITCIFLYIYRHVCMTIQLYWMCKRQHMHFSLCIKWHFCPWNNLGWKACLLSFFYSIMQNSQHYNKW